MRWEREREAVRGDACWEEEEEREEEETAKSSSRNSSTDQRTVLLPDFCESFSSARPKRRASVLPEWPSSSLRFPILLCQQSLTHTWKHRSHWHAGAICRLYSWHRLAGTFSEYFFRSSWTWTSPLTGSQLKALPPKTCRSGRTCPRAEISPGPGWSKGRQSRGGAGPSHLPWPRVPRLPAWPHGLPLLASSSSITHRDPLWRLGQLSGNDCTTGTGFVNPGTNEYQVWGYIYVIFKYAFNAAQWLKFPLII